MRTPADRTRRVIRGVIAAAAALLVAAPTTLGAVTFDPSNGTGHLDRADVQSAFGWRDQTFAANARKVAFHLRSVGSLTWDCAAGSLVADVDDSRAVDAHALGATSRRNGLSVSGYDLTGFSGGSTSTAQCSSGAPTNVVWSGSRVLYADFRNQSAPVWSD